MRNLSRKLINLLVPPRCLGCGVEVQEPHSLCAECWPQLHFIQAPVCITCGVPMPESASPEAECLDCINHPPPFYRARAALSYHGIVAGMVTRFKYGDQLHMVERFTLWMQQAGAELLKETEMIVPVPLHWTRLFTRRFNQAALLAQRLSEKSGIPYCPRLLVRRRRTPPQASLSRSQRLRNVQGAFRLHPKTSPDTVKGKTVLLIDDVMTTGATIHACARALKRAGARKVLVLTAARTLQGE